MSLVLVISPRLNTALSINSLRVNNTSNDISFRQQARGFHGNVASFSEHRTSTTLAVLVSRESGVPQKPSIQPRGVIYMARKLAIPLGFSENQNFGSCTESLGRLTEALTLIFRARFCWLFFISWNPYFEQVHQASGSNAKLCSLAEPNSALRCELRRPSQQSWRNCFCCSCSLRLTFSVKDLLPLQISLSF